MVSQQIAVDNFKQFLATELDTFHDTVARLTKPQGGHVEEVRDYAQNLLSRVHRQFEQIHDDFQPNDALDIFRSTVKLYLEYNLCSDPRDRLRPR